MKKIKLIYDATIISSGLVKNAARSGIFFTGLEIFRALLKRSDVELVAFSNPQKFSDLKKVCKIEFPNHKIKIIKNSLFRENINRLKILPIIIGKNVKLLNLIIEAIFVITKNLNEIYTNIILKQYNNYDAYFSPNYVIPDSVRKLDIEKKCILLHDVNPIILKKYFFAENAGGWFYKLIKQLNHDDYYFTNSNSTRNDFLKYFPQIDENKITTTLLACNERFKVSHTNIDEIKNKYNIPLDKKYTFSLCTIEPRKNLIRIVKTFINFIQENKIEDLVFVIGGGEWSTFVGQLEKEIENLNKYNNIIIKAGYIDDEDLPILYSNAEWVTYTSEYEGFGLPVLEAMNCGCPVITSNNSSLPEVIGDAGILIDWDSDKQHIEAYKKYYYDLEYKNKKAMEGLERSKNFSWEKCVEQILQVIRK